MQATTRQHKTSGFFRLFILMVSAVLLTAGFGSNQALAAQATLAWDAPTTKTDGSPLTGLAGYRVYVGKAPGTYTQNFNVGNLSTYTVNNLSDATNYYFAVTAYDTAGLVSTFSNELLYTTPATPVAIYTITASAGSGGSITPSGALVLSRGMSQTYSIAPAAGYRIASVTVNGVSVGAVATYTFSSISASHTITASFTPATTTPTPTTPTQTAFAVNSGGAAFTSPSGVAYLADSRFTGGSTAKTTAVITGTTEGALYQSERWGNFSYSVPVVNGNYSVTLKFAEIYFAAAGKRVFSVAINGRTVVSNLDIFAKVGKNAAYDVVVPVSVTTGAMNVTFTSTVDLAKISGIRIAPAAAVTPGATPGVLFATNSGGAQFTDSTGTVYPADGRFTGGTAARTTAAIAGTTDDVLYQSERWGNFSYSVPVANGNYSVTLKFAEIYFSAAGKRVFSVAINGQSAISNLDLFARVGKNVAYDVTIPVAVINGAITINFTGQVDDAKVSAIQIKAL